MEFPRDLFQEIARWCSLSTKKQLRLLNRFFNHLISTQFVWQVLSIYDRETLIRSNDRDRSKVEALHFSWVEEMADLANSPQDLLSCFPNISSLSFSRCTNVSTWPNVRFLSISFDPSQEPIGFHLLSNLEELDILGLNQSELPFGGPKLSTITLRDPSLLPRIPCTVNTLILKITRMFPPHIFKFDVPLDLPVTKLKLGNVNADLFCHCASIQEMELLWANCHHDGAVTRFPINCTRLTIRQWWEEPILLILPPQVKTLILHHAVRKSQWLAFIHSELEEIVYYPLGWHIGRDMFPSHIRIRLVHPQLEASIRDMDTFEREEMVSDDQVTEEWIKEHEEKWINQYSFFGNTVGVKVYFQYRISGWTYYPRDI